MNRIEISQNTVIQLESADLLTANSSFYHVDRIAPFNVLIYCIKGNIYVGEDDEDYNVGPGELLLLKHGHHQRPTARICEGTSWIYAHFYTCNLDLVQKDAADFIGNTESLLLPKKACGLHNTLTEDRLFTLINIIHSTGDSRKVIASSLLQMILVSLYDDSRENSQYDLADMIRIFLDDSTKVSISTAELEDEFHLSYKYMEHVFRQKTGISIMQYHTKIRIKEIARVLRSTNISISEVSETYGFNDPLYFSRCFKKHMGLSPQAYRTGKILT